MAHDKASIGRFEHLLDLHGPHLDRWPAGDAAFARGLIAREPVARAMLDASTRLDGALARIAKPVALPADNLGRLIEGLARRRDAARDPFMSLFRPRAAFAMTVVGCMMLGLGAWTGGTVTTSADQIAFAALDIGDQPLSGFDQ